jgi:hypothetical protein
VERALFVVVTLATPHNTCHTTQHGPHHTTRATPHNTGHTTHHAHITARYAVLLRFNVIRVARVVRVIRVIMVIKVVRVIRVIRASMFINA